MLCAIIVKFIEGKFECDRMDMGLELELQLNEREERNESDGWKCDTGMVENRGTIKHGGTQKVGKGIGISHNEMVEKWKGIEIKA